jgi:hypothetical protein
MMAPVSGDPPPLLELSDAAVVDEGAPDVVATIGPPEVELLELYTDCVLVCPPHVISVDPAVV